MPERKRAFENDVLPYTHVYMCVHITAITQTITIKDPKCILYGRNPSLLQETLPS